MIDCGDAVTVFESPPEKKIEEFFPQSSFFESPVFHHLLAGQLFQAARFREFMIEGLEFLVDDIGMYPLESEFLPDKPSAYRPRAELAAYPSFGILSVIEVSEMLEFGCRFPNDAFAKTLAPELLFHLVDGTVGILEKCKRLLDGFVNFLVQTQLLPDMDVAGYNREALL